MSCLIVRPKQFAFQCGVPAILYSIVRPAGKATLVSLRLKQLAGAYPASTYLPGNSLAICAHLFPKSEWAYTQQRNQCQLTVAARQVRLTSCSRSVIHREGKLALIMTLSSS